jgi:crotonobetainyl-CoA:carnitine CoA-transferase CaiB-like acyl-CoA transferase
MSQSEDGLLSGVKVLEFGQFFAAPTASRMMTDMGAEVVKMELAPRGDYLRVYAPVKAGQSGIFMLENRGKLSVCLDIKRDEGVQVAKELAAKADVLIENFSPGVLIRRGLGYEDLRKANPRLIMCSISGFGQTGPLSHRNGNDTMAVAMSGLTYLTGDPNGAPSYIGASIADANAGIHAFSAICAALFKRSQTGTGQHLDISLVASLFNLHDLPLARYIMSNGADNPMRTGSHLGGASPCGIFKATDGYIIITVLQHQWDNFANTIGKPELLSDPRFNTIDERAKHMPELIAIIEQWLQSFPTRDEPLAILAEHRVLSAPVLDIGQAMNHPQMKSRGVMQEVEHPGIGPVPLPRAPFVVSGASVEIRARTPFLGEHNADVLSRYLGYSKEQVAELTKAGVLVEDPLPT